MDENNQNSKAGTRGPNYNWEIEARSLSKELQDIRDLLHRIDSNAEKVAYERDKFKIALQEIAKVTYGTELCNSEEENNEILASHFFYHQQIARKALTG